MHRQFLYLVASTLLCSPLLEGLENIKIDDGLRRQILQYDPEHEEWYYSKKIPMETLLEFLDVYEYRPIRNNGGGIRAQGMFFLWYLLKEINPTLVIENGVWNGGSSWLIDQAAPNAEFIAIDPSLHFRFYFSERANYLSDDFAYLSLNPEIKGPIVAFFDDHQNAFERVIQSAEKGIKHLIFDDNYPLQWNDGFPHLTLAVCLTLPQHKEKADILKKLIKYYYVMPQVIGRTATNGESTHAGVGNIPSIWENLNDVEPHLREKFRVFSDDSIWYRWMTYVELY